MFNYIVWVFNQMTNFFVSQSVVAAALIIALTFTLSKRITTKPGNTKRSSETVSTNMANNYTLTFYVR